MLLTADVEKLKCIYFSLIKARVDVDWYGIKCNTSQIDTDINTSRLYLDLLEISPTVCRSLECKILEFNESKSSYCTTCDNDCTTRDTSTSVAPTLTLSGPGNMNIQIQSPATTSVVNYAITYATNCDYGVVVSRTLGLASGSSFPIGVTTVTHQATNGCSLTTTYTFTVTVQLAS